MTQNNRIALNTVATYARSIFGVLCGIFSTRWVLEALGQEDFGLYAVIGGMAIFLSFLNIQLAGAISRYYAYSIGQAKVLIDADVGVRECRAWFTTALLIHTIVPLVLLIIGWPLGIYAIEHAWVCVPVDRLGACLSVWRYVCLFTFLGMVTVPFQAMYTAKQFIAELTIYKFVETVAKTAFIYYMVTNPREWLVGYALMIGLIGAAPQIVICIRAIKIFPECRIVINAFRDWRRVRDIASYAVWTAIGGIGYVASHQCMGILLNNFYGARIAGSFGVSQTVSGEAASLTGALQGAFQPAITTTYGTGDLDSMRNMAYRVCKIGTLLTLMFAIPMGLEIDQILIIWLKNPPQYAGQMCMLTLLFIALEKLTCGHIAAVNSTGRIAKFQATRGFLRALVIPLALLPAVAGWGVIATTAALPLSVVLVLMGDAFLSKRIVGMKIQYWLKSVVLPVGMFSVVVILTGSIPIYLLPPSFSRIIITSCVTLGAMLPLALYLVLSQEERNYVFSGIGRFCRKIHISHNLREQKGVL